MSVSIHAPVWGANKNDVVADCVVMFQSTHPCGVRMSKLDIKKAIEVSIHAPVWGANNTQREKMRSARFQSTHPCGVRS